MAGPRAAITHAVCQPVIKNNSGRGASRGGAGEDVGGDHDHVLIRDRPGQPNTSGAARSGMSIRAWGEVHSHEAYPTAASRETGPL